MATAIVAQKIILNKRASDKSRTNPDAADNIVTLDEMVTDEIRRMITDPDDLQSSESAFHYSTTAPDGASERWDNG